MGELTTIVVALHLRRNLYAAIAIAMRAAQNAYKCNLCPARSKCSKGGGEGGERGLCGGADMAHMKSDKHAHYMAAHFGE